MSIFFAIFMAYILMNIWIIGWLWRNLRGSGWVRIGVCLLFTVLTCLYPSFFRSSGSSGIELFLLEAGAVWAGTFFYTFMFTVLADVFYLIRKRSGRNSPPPRYAYCAVVVSLSALLSLAGMINAGAPVLYELDLPVELKADAPAGLDGKEMTVAVMSDIHIGRLVRTGHVSKIVELLKPFKPDVVLFAGDILDDHILVDTENLRRLFAELNSPLGLWGVAGNHEYHSGELSDSLELIDRMGIRMLVDDYTVLDHSILLVGRNDYSVSRRGGTSRETLSAILERVPEQARKLPLLVLDHQPNQLKDAEEVGAFLQISGHTHRGQLWPGNHILNLLFEVPHGYFRKGYTQYLVSAGVGTWGPPIRNTARPEVFLIRFRFMKAAPGNKDGGHN